MVPHTVRPLTINGSTKELSGTQSHPFSLHLDSNCGHGNTNSLRLFDSPASQDCFFAMLGAQGFLKEDPKMGWENTDVILCPFMLCHSDHYKPFRAGLTHLLAIEKPKRERTVLLSFPTEAQIKFAPLTQVI